MLYPFQKKSRFTKRFIFTYMILVGGVLLFLGGIYTGHHIYWGNVPQSPASVEHATDVSPSKDIDLTQFWDVWNLVKKEYVDQPVSDKTLLYGAMAGIVASLGDPYSTFFDPETTKKFKDELSGVFQGIGAEIGIKKEQLVIIAPLPGSPAERAGLKAGDKILGIDKQETLGMPLDIAVSRIRGKKGTAVTLNVLRNGWKEQKEFSITRDVINIESVTVKELSPTISYIKINAFNETVLDLFEKALTATLRQNAKGIILDLRNNPGGFLEVGVQVASEWVPEGKTVVIQEFQGGRREEIVSHGLARLKGIPTVVLINPGSASASEIVAGALKDYGAATLVGEKSFGKGTVQTFPELKDGSSVKLTIAHWLTPKGSSINRQGISPNVEVKIGQADYDNDKDPQLQKAIELLTK